MNILAHFENYMEQLYDTYKAVFQFIAAFKHCYYVINLKQLIEYANLGYFVIKCIVHILRTLK